MAKGIVNGGLNSGGGNNVKSIQSGFALDVNLTPTLTIPINSINVNNSILFFSNSTTGVPTEIAYIQMSGKIADSNNISFAVHSNGSHKIAWRVIEFSKLKSRQSGSVTQNASTYDIPINPVDPLKCLIQVSFKADFTSGADAKNTKLSYYLLDSSTIRVIGRNAINRTIEWQVIEF